MQHQCLAGTGNALALVDVVKAPQLEGTTPPDTDSVLSNSPSPPPNTYDTLESTAAATNRQARSGLIDDIHVVQLASPCTTLHTSQSVLCNTQRTVLTDTRGQPTTTTEATDAEAPVERRPEEAVADAEGADGPGEPDVRICPVPNSQLEDMKTTELATDADMRSIALRSVAGFHPLGRPEAAPQESPSELRTALSPSPRERPPPLRAVDLADRHSPEVTRVANPQFFDDTFFTLQAPVWPPVVAARQLELSEAVQLDVYTALQAVADGALPSVVTVFEVGDDGLRARVTYESLEAPLSSKEKAALAASPLEHTWAVYHDFHAAAPLPLGAASRDGRVMRVGTPQAAGLLRDGTPEDGNNIQCRATHYAYLQTSQSVLSDTQRTVLTDTRGQPTTTTEVIDAEAPVERRPEEAVADAEGADGPGEPDVRICPVPNSQLEDMKTTELATDADMRSIALRSVAGFHPLGRPEAAPQETPCALLAANQEGLTAIFTLEAPEWAPVVAARQLELSEAVQLDVYTALQAVADGALPSVVTVFEVGDDGLRARVTYESLEAPLSSKEKAALAASPLEHTWAVVMRVGTPQAAGLLRDGTPEDGNNIQCRATHYAYLQTSQSVLSDTQRTVLTDTRGQPTTTTEVIDAEAPVERRPEEAVADAEGADGPGEPDVRICPVPNSQLEDMKTTELATDADMRSIALRSVAGFHPLGRPEAAPQETPCALLAANQERADTTIFTLEAPEWAPVVAARQLELSEAVQLDVYTALQAVADGALPSVVTVFEVGDDGLRARVTYESLEAPLSSKEKAALAASPLEHTWAVVMRVGTPQAAGLLRDGTPEDGNNIQCRATHYAYLQTSQSVLSDTQRTVLTDTRGQPTTTTEVIDAEAPVERRPEEAVADAEGADGPGEPDVRICPVPNSQLEDMKTTELATDADMRSIALRSVAGFHPLGRPEAAPQETPCALLAANQERADTTIFTLEAPEWAPVVAARQLELSEAVQLDVYTALQAVADGALPSVVTVFEVGDDGLRARVTYESLEAPLSSKEKAALAASPLEHTWAVVMRVGTPQAAGLLRDGTPEDGNNIQCRATHYAYLQTSQSVLSDTQRTVLTDTRGQPTTTTEVIDAEAPVERRPEEAVADAEGADGPGEPDVRICPVPNSQLEDMKTTELATDADMRSIALRSVAGFHPLGRPEAAPQETPCALLAANQERADTTIFTLEAPEWAPVVAARQLELSEAVQLDVYTALQAVADGALPSVVTVFEVGDDGLRARVTYESLEAPLSSKEKAALAASPLEHTWAVVMRVGTPQAAGLLRDGTPEDGNNIQCRATHYAYLQTSQSVLSDTQRTVLTDTRGQPTTTTEVIDAEAPVERRPEEAVADAEGADGPGEPDVRICPVPNSQLEDMKTTELATDADMRSIALRSVAGFHPLGRPEAAPQETPCALLAANQERADTTIFTLEAPEWAPVVAARQLELSEAVQLDVYTALQAVADGALPSVVTVFEVGDDGLRARVTYESLEAPLSSKEKAALAASPLEHTWAVYHDFHAAAPLPLGAASRDGRVMRVGTPQAAGLLRDGTPEDGNNIQCRATHYAYLQTSQSVLSDTQRTVLTDTRGQPTTTTEVIDAEAPVERRPEEAVADAEGADGPGEPDVRICPVPNSQLEDMKTTELATDADMRSIALRSVAGFHPLGRPEAAPQETPPVATSNFIESARVAGAAEPCEETLLTLGASDWAAAVVSREPNATEKVLIAPSTLVAKERQEGSVPHRLMELYADRRAIPNYMGSKDAGMSQLKPQIPSAIMGTASGRAEKLLERSGGDTSGIPGLVPIASRTTVPALGSRGREPVAPVTAAAERSNKMVPRSVLKSNPTPSVAHQGGTTGPRAGEPVQRNTAETNVLSSTPQVPTSSQEVRSQMVGVQRTGEASCFCSTGALQAEISSRRRPPTVPPATQAPRGHFLEPAAFGEAVASPRSELCRDSRPEPPQPLADEGAGYLEPRAVTPPAKPRTKNPRHGLPPVPQSAPQSETPAPGGRVGKRAVRKVMKVLFKGLRWADLMQGRAAAVEHAFKEDATRMVDIPCQVAVRELKSLEDCILVEVGVRAADKATADAAVRQLRAGEYTAVWSLYHQWVEAAESRRSAPSSPVTTFHRLRFEGKAWFVVLQERFDAFTTALIKDICSWFGALPGEVQLLGVSCQDGVVVDYVVVFKPDTATISPGVLHAERCDRVRPSTECVIPYAAMMNPMSEPQLARSALSVGLEF
eukprot:gene10644-7392_t